jgi:hypothetical protein
MITNGSEAAAFTLANDTIYFTKSRAQLVNNERLFFFQQDGAKVHSALNGYAV